MLSVANKLSRQVMMIKMMLILMMILMILTGLAEIHTDLVQSLQWNKLRRWMEERHSARLQH